MTSIADKWPFLLVIFSIQGIRSLKPLQLSLHVTNHVLSIVHSFTCNSVHASNGNFRLLILAGLTRNNGLRIMSRKLGVLNILLQAIASISKDAS